MSKTYLEVDPTTVVLDPNIRGEARLDSRFLASIRERGNLEPVLAYRDGEGRIVVTEGQRRTLAAREVGATLRVLVDDTPPTTADRLVDQWTENEHRADLTNRERVEAVRQMTLEGLSVGQIARRTATAKTAVDAAAKVAASPAALAVADGITLDHAAAIAEFDGDDDAVARLTDCAQRGGHRFDHEVQRLRNDRAEQTAIADAAETLRGTGVTVVDPPGWDDKTTRRLEDLRDPDGQRLDPEQHATGCPGHVAWLTIGYPGWRYEVFGNDEEDDDLDEDGTDDAEGTEAAGGSEEPEPEGPRPVVVYGCCGWAAHGHRDRYDRPGTKRAADMTETEREAATAARRHVIQSNKDWAAATTVRRDWLRGFAARKTAPVGAETYLAAVISERHVQQVGAHDLLGLTQQTVATELATATSRRALHLALALTLASWEQATTTDTWRRPDLHDQATLAALGGWGYDLSEIEQRIIDGTAADPT